MPTYEYQCEKCRKGFEIFQSMKDPVLQVCPKDLCRMRTWGKGKVKRLLGAGAGLIFKGSGFYITDYRSNSYKEGAKSEKPAESKPAAAEKTNAASAPAASNASKKTPKKKD